MKLLHIATIYAVLGGTLLLASCRQDEDVPGDLRDVSDRRIVFRSSLPELSSKAQDATAASLSYFNLTAFDGSDNDYIESDGTLSEYFSDKMLEKSEGSNNFFSDQCLWPELGHEKDLLHFFAYYPQLPTGAKLVNKSSVADSNPSLSYGITGYTINTDIAEQVDFLAAHASGTMENNFFSGVELNFKHQLSRIEVMAKGLSKTFTLEIAGVRIGGIPTKADFSFPTNNKEADWTITDDRSGVAEYIYRTADQTADQIGDTIVKINDTKEAVSILGEKVANYAMLLPSQFLPDKNEYKEYPAWAFATDRSNTNGGMYLSILLRVLDKTPTDKLKQQYPYFDNSQGINAMKIPRVVLEVDENGIVTENHGILYKDAEGNYFRDAQLEESYTGVTASAKEFGWASVPISGIWEPGYAYTYTLDFTYGVGLHGPDVTAPDDMDPEKVNLYLKAGDPIISDRVGVSLGFKDWTIQEPTGIEVPGN